MGVIVNKNIIRSETKETTLGYAEESGRFSDRAKRVSTTVEMDYGGDLDIDIIFIDGKVDEFTITRTDDTPRRMYGSIDNQYMITDTNGKVVRNIFTFNDTIRYDYDCLTNKCTSLERYKSGTSKEWYTDKRNDCHILILPQSIFKPNKYIPLLSKPFNHTKSAFNNDYWQIYVPVYIGTTLDEPEREVLLIGEARLVNKFVSESYSSSNVFVREDIVYGFYIDRLIKMFDGVTREDFDHLCIVDELYRSIKQRVEDGLTKTIGSRIINLGFTNNKTDSFDLNKPIITYDVESQCMTYMDDKTVMAAQNGKLDTPYKSIEDLNVAK